MWSIQPNETTMPLCLKFCPISGTAYLWISCHLLTIDMQLVGLQTERVCKSVMNEIIKRPKSNVACLVGYDHYWTHVFSGGWFYKLHLVFLTQYSVLKNGQLHFYHNHHFHHTAILLTVIIIQIISNKNTLTMWHASKSIILLIDIRGE